MYLLLFYILFIIYLYMYIDVYIYIYIHVDTYICCPISHEARKQGKAMKFGQSIEYNDKNIF